MSHRLRVIAVIHYHLISCTLHPKQWILTAHFRQSAHISVCPCNSDRGVTLLNLAHCLPPCDTAFNRYCKLCAFLLCHMTRFHGDRCYCNQESVFSESATPNFYSVLLKLVVQYLALFPRNLRLFFTMGYPI